MKIEELFREVEGIKTIEMLQKQFNVDRARAIYIIYRLRKRGYVKTIYGAGKIRTYIISLRNKQGGKSYTDVINEASPIQLASSNPYYVHGRIPSCEEALIYAIKQKDIRYLIASLALFRKIAHWSFLYTLAKKEDLVNEIVALYDVSRRVVKKVKRIPRRFLNQAERKKTKHFKYIIKPFSSDDFRDLEKKWRVYIPLNLADLEDYKND